MTDTLSEIKDIFDHVMKSQFIPPEDIDEASAKFKMIYLTLENKNEFLSFLFNYLKEVNDNDEYIDERISYLQNEIDSFFDRIPSIFSIHHIGGYKDPNDKDESGNLSKDADDSFDFMKQHNLNNNLFGPEIPEHLKPVVIKVLEKISIFHDQQVTNRIELMSKWRLLRLSNKIEKIKNQVPAMLTIQKYMRNNFNTFYTLRNFAKDSKSEETKLEKAKSGGRSALEDELYRLRQELDVFKSGVAKNGNISRLDRSTPSSSMISVNLEKEVLDAKQKLKEKEDMIKSLLEEKKKFNGNFSNILQSNVSNDEQLRSFKQQIATLEAKMINLNKENESKTAMLKEQYCELLETKNAMEKMHAELKRFKIEDKKNSLSTFGKVRFLLKIAKGITNKLKSYAFYKLNKRSQKAGTSLENVGDRVKARILVQTRNLNCGQDMRRSFLRWLIKSDPDLLRETFVKIGVTAKISHQIAIWRLKKLVFKPMHTKLPEAVKAVRRLKAFFMLTELYNHRGIIEKKYFLNNLNPNHMSQREALLHRVLVERSKSHISDALQYTVRKLKKRTDIERSVIQKIYDNYSFKTKVGMFALRLKKNHQNNLRYINRLLTGSALLQNMVKRRERDFFGRIKNKTADLFKRLVDALTNKGQFKSSKAFAKLRENNQQFIKQQNQEAFDARVKNLKSKHFIQKLIGQKASKIGQAFSKLSELNKLKKSQILRNNQKVKSLFEKFGEFRKTKLSQALSNLIKNKNFSRSQKGKIDNIIKLFVAKQKLKQKAVFDHIYDYNATVRSKSAVLQAKQRKLLATLAYKTEAKGLSVLGQLKSINTLSSQKLAKIKDRFLSLLKSNTQANLSDTIRRLQNNVFDSKTKDNQKNKRDLHLKKLLRNTLLKTSKAFDKLKATTLENKRQGEINQKQKINLSDRLNKALKAKMANALHSLRNMNHVARLLKFVKENKLRNLFAGLTSSYEDKARGTLRALDKHTKKEVMSMKNLKEQQNKILLRLISRFNLIRRNTIKKLQNHKNDTKKQEFVQNTKIRTLMDYLNESADKKTFKALQTLRSNLSEVKAIELKQLNAKKLLLSKLVDGTESSSSQVLRKLALHRIETNQKNLEESKLKKNLLKALLRLKDKMKTALEKLRNHTTTTSNDETLLKMKQKMALLRLFFPSKFKVTKALDFLRTEAFKQVISEKANSTRVNFEQKLKVRKQNGLMYLLIASLEGKCSNVLFKLIRISKEMKLQEAKRKERLRNRVQIFVDYIQRKVAVALQKLVLHKYDKNLEAEDIDRKKTQKLRLFAPSSGNVQDTSSFSSLVNNMKIFSKTKPNNATFDAILKELQMNNKDGRFNDILEKIRKGEIQTLEDLNSYISKNNKDGKFDKILDIMNDDRREIKDLLKFMKMNNADGKYDELIKLIESNPNFGKADVLTYIANHPNPEKFDELTKKIDGNKKLDDLIAFMKENNADGIYDKPLMYLRKHPNPQLSDLVQFLLINNDPIYDGLRNELNKDDIPQNVKDVLKFMKENNGDGRYTDFINFIEKLKDPKISDIFKYLKDNNKDGKLDGVMALINGLGSQPGKDFFDLLEKHNHDGVFTPIINAFKSNPTAKLTDMFEFILKNNKDGKLNRAIDLFNEPTKFQLYKDLINFKNTDGSLDDILDHTANLKNPKLTDLMKFMMNNNADGRFNSLIAQIAKNEDLKPLMNLLKREENLQKCKPLADFLASKPGASIFDALELIQRNNRDGKYDDVLKLINGENKQLTFDSMMNFMKRNNKNGKYDEILKDIHKLPNPKLSDLYHAIVKHNINGVHKELLDQLNGLGPLKIDQLLKFAKMNNQDGRYDSFIKHIESIKDPKLTDAIDFIANNNKDGSLNDLKEIIDEENKRNLLKNAIQFMENNNSNGKYNEIFAELKKLEKPTLLDLINIVKNKNTNGQFNELWDLLNEKEKSKEVDDLIDYLKRNNANGEYNDLLETIKLMKNPKLSDILNYISNNNADGKFSDVLNKINGKGLNNDKIIDFMNLRNKNGRFNPILEFLKSNPKATLTQLLDHIKKLNTDHQFDDLLDFINNGGVISDNNKDYDPDDLLKFLGMARARGEFKELFDFMDKNNIDDPEVLLDYLRKNNKNGEYDSLIAKAIKYISKNAANKDASESGFSFSRPSLEKMRICLNRLRELNKEENAKKQDNLNNLGEIIELMITRNEMRKAAALSRLVLNMKDANLKITKNNHSISKLIAKLQNAANKKSLKALNELSENNKEVKETLRKKAGAVNTLSNKFGLSSKKKAACVLSAMKSHSEKTKQAFQRALDMISKQTQSKLKSALKELSNNNKLQKLRNLNITGNLGKLIKSQKGRLLQTLMKLKKHKDIEVMREHLRNVKLKKMMNRLFGNHQEMLKDTLHRLQSLLNKTKHSDQFKKDKTRFLIAKILAGSKNKLIQTIASLKDNKQNSKFNQQKTEKLKSRFGVLLDNSSRGKLEQAIKKLLANKNAILNLQVNKNAKVKRLFKSLGGSNQDKLRQALEKLIKNSKDSEKNQLKNNAKISNLMSILAEKRRENLKKPWNSLAQNKYTSLKTDQQNQQRTKGLQFIRSKLKERNTSDLQTCLNRLRQNNSQVAQSQLSKTERLKKLSLLWGAKSAAKMAEVLKKLRANRQQLKNQDAAFALATSKIVRNVKASSDLKLKSAISTLNSNKFQKAKVQLNREQMLNNLFRSFANKTKSKLKETLAKLRQAKDVANLNSSKRNEILKRNFNRLSAARKLLLASALQKLKEQQLSRRFSSTKNLDCQKRLINGLIAKNKLKQSRALQTLLKNKQHQSFASSIKQQKLTKVLGRLCKAKLFSCFEKLIINHLSVSLRVAKHKRHLARIQSNSQIKSVKVLGKLNKMALAKKLQGQLKAAVLFNVLETMRLRKRSNALLSVKNYIKKLVLDRSNAAKVVRKNVLADMSHFTRNLKMHNFLAKRNKLNSIISSLIFGLRKNHRTNLRHAIDVWSQKQLKNKLQNFSNILAGILQRRMTHAYEKIKVDYYVKKYRKLIKGIMNLVALVENRKKELKRVAMKEMVGQFIDNNPWFRKVIQILAINSKPNDQISFWRMRYAKNLKKEGVSAEQGLKIKKFDSLIRKHLLSSFSNAFWKISSVNMPTQRELGNSVLLNTRRI